jgi:hypothetical protein
MFGSLRKVFGNNPETKINIHFRCNNTGLTVPTNFSNCVDGRKVDNFETPYDFDSVMHYGAYA